MVRNLFCTMTAVTLLLAACGDDKNDTSATANTEPATTSSGTTANPSGDDTTGSTGPVDPTTAGEAEASVSTTVDPSTGPIDPSTSTGPTTIPPDTSATEPMTETTVDPDTTDPSTTTGGDPVEQCKMMADPQTECSDCVCENCLEQLQACEMDEGCKAIRQCAEETGCTGFDCLQLCGDVIDMYGGIGGESAQKGLQISMCLDMNCMEQCAG
jgi:hypothetical protein